jgi:hypothetical protein
VAKETDQEEKKARDFRKIRPNQNLCGSQGPKGKFSLKKISPKGCCQACSGRLDWNQQVCGPPAEKWTCRIWTGMTGPAEPKRKPKRRDFSPRKPKRQEKLKKKSALMHDSRSKNQSARLKKTKCQVQDSRREKLKCKTQEVKRRNQFSIQKDLNHSSQEIVFFVCT